jgi:hypothetical protein
MHVSPSRTKRIHIHAGKQHEVYVRMEDRGSNCLQMTRRSLITFDPSIRPQPGKPFYAIARRSNTAKGQLNSKYATAHITHNQRSRHPPHTPKSLHPAPAYNQVFLFSFGFKPNQTYQRILKPPARVSPSEAQSLPCRDRMFLPALALQPEPFNASSTPQRAVSASHPARHSQSDRQRISNVYVIELSQGCRTAVELLFKRI